MMPTVLRAAEPSDQAAIHDLMVDVITASVDAPYRPETIANVLQNLGRWRSDPDNGLHLVALAGDAVVGVVLVKEFWNLCSLFVARRCQRQGIGRALVLAAIEGCRGRSPRQAIHLNAAPAAVGFYRSLGFVDRASGQPLPPGFVPMRLPLAA